MFIMTLGLMVNPEKARTQEMHTWMSKTKLQHFKMTQMLSIGTQLCESTLFFTL